MNTSTSLPMNANPRYGEDRVPAGARAAAMVDEAPVSISPVPEQVTPSPRHVSADPWHGDFWTANFLLVFPIALVIVFAVFAVALST